MDSCSQNPADTRVKLVTEPAVRLAVKTACVVHGPTTTTVGGVVPYPEPPAPTTSPLIVP